MDSTELLAFLDECKRLHRLTERDTNIEIPEYDMFAFASENVRRETIHKESTKEEGLEDEANTPVADSSTELQGQPSATIS
jgi:hypothetical protein